MKHAFIKNLAWSFIAAAVAGYACSDAEDIAGPNENPEVPSDPSGPSDEPLYADLSRNGTANCYIVTEAGNYSMRAHVRGNGASSEGIVPAEVEPVSAKLIWQTSPGMIKDVSVDGSDINFVVKRSGGSALIGALDVGGNIIWSWHIWMPDGEPSGLPGKQGYEVMDMNLGALSKTAGSADSYGMLYQWGRKDPFPASATLTGDTQTVGAPLYNSAGGAVEITAVPAAEAGLDFSIANPTVYIAGKDWLAEPADNLWGNPLGAVRDEENNFPNKGTKSVYDPCPPGWRVPPADVFRNFTSSGGYSWTIDEFDIYDLSGNGVKDEGDWKYGWVFNLSEGNTSYFPAAGRYYGEYGMLYGSVAGLWGNYWGNCPNGEFGYAVAAFQNTAEGITLSPAAGGARADGYSVRCIRE